MFYLNADPPTFVKKVENTTAVLGSAVKLQGTVKGSAPISVKWLKDSDLLTEVDPNIKITFENNIAQLAIASVAITHGGKYTCQAENEAGQQKSEATLSVQGLTWLNLTFIYQVDLLHLFIQSITDFEHVVSACILF